ncbi:DUF3108 domain-containing protein [Candidatus Nitrotoga sp. M5]|uniref:DUF3108 domain-containing protein n=1 Tax=Candidatus Nitrotoga sp. M5 TaxID=2890409 RepID=UPI001EF531FA|nr:DUF3108 domain-containing protein [Candidatus Nitrotoga sp. M5]CAH1388202.1 conserved exported hypothetical protein [Candidatus Nitrotoga sp. M5]
MRHIIYLAGLLLLISSAPQVLFAATPSVPVQATQIDAHYDVLKGNIKVASVTETYTRTQSGYHIESVTKAIGLLAMFKPEVIHVTSEGTLTEKGLRPLTYIQKRKLDTERNTRADFDWKAKQITLTDRAGKRTLPLPAGTQDRLSAMYQFMFAPLQNSTELKFKMTNGSKVDDYSYRIMPDQNITTPLGTFKTYYVANPPQDGENRTEIWLATQHGNFPYKMTVTEPDGAQLTQMLSKINFK